jgi:hypothetical protein
MPSSRCVYSTSISPAFRPRFTYKRNAELTKSKRVIGIFAQRFANLQNSHFFHDLDISKIGSGQIKPNADAGGSDQTEFFMIFSPFFHPIRENCNLLIIERLGSV